MLHTIKKYKKIYFFLITILFIFNISSIAWAISNNGKIVKVKKLKPIKGVSINQITYISDNLKVKGLMFIPKSKPQLKLPCIIFCHDGISGISKEHKLSSIRLSKAGYAVFSPSYRGEDDSEGEIEIAKGEVSDVLNAIKMVSSIRKIDKKKIGLIGASHGALICLLAASRTDKIKVLVEAYGVTDIYKWWHYLKKHNKIGKDKITRQTYGKGPKDRPNSFKIRNAISKINKISCPVLILQGKLDKIVPPEQAIFLKNALDKHKIPNKIKIYPNCLHGFLVYAPYINNVEKKEKIQTEKAWKVMLNFLKINL